MTKKELLEKITKNEMDIEELKKRADSNTEKFSLLADLSNKYFDIEDYITEERDDNDFLFYFASNQKKVVKQRFILKDKVVNKNKK